MKLKNLFLFSLSSIISSATTIGLASLYRFLVDDIFPFAKLHLFYLTFNLYLILSIILFLLLFFNIFFIKKVGLRITLKIRKKLFGKILNLPFEILSKRGSAYYSSRILDDSSIASNLYSSSVYNILKLIFIFIIEIPFLFLIDKNITIISLIFILFFGFIIFFISRKGRELSKNVIEIFTVYKQNLLETIQGFITIKAFSANRYFYKKNEEVFKENIEKSIHLSLFNNWVLFLYEGVPRLIMTLFIYCLGGYFVIRGNLSLGSVLGMSLVITSIINSTTIFASSITKIQTYKAADDRVNHIINSDNEKDGNREVDVSGKIEFKDVWFKYEREEWILKGLNFSIKEREKVSIVGRSGVGKTTITNILLGYYSPQKGKILIDGNDLFEIKRSCLRSQIAVIPQNIFIFSGTLKENILLDYDVKEKELENVLDKSGINEMLGRLPEGMETELGERGFRLSGGEKQRIAIARVLLRKPSIVLFDEATSSLDNYSEKCINIFLTEWGRNKTFITIAHRLSTIRNSERIIFIEDGIVNKSGSHEELLKIPTYYKLIKGELDE